MAYADNTTSPPPAQPPAASEVDQDPDIDKHKYVVPDKPSAGEKAFNKLTYAGIGYFANLALSLVIWDYFLSGGGKPALNAMARGGGKLLKAGGMNAAGAEKWAHTAVSMGLSTMGGHITMIPLKIAEDHARYITHTANKLLDKNYAYKDVKANWNTPEDDLPPLVNEPTDQTWTQIALRRGLSTVTVSAAGTALHRIGMDAPLQNGTLGVFNKGIELSRSASLQRFAQQEIVQRYTKLAALDLYFTGITSAITAMTSRMFGKQKVEHLATGPAAPGADTPPTPLLTIAQAAGQETANPLARHENFAAHAAAAEPNYSMAP